MPYSKRKFTFRIEHMNNILTRCYLFDGNILNWKKNYSSSSFFNNRILLSVTDLHKFLYGKTTGLIGDYHLYFNNSKLINDSLLIDIPNNAEIIIKLDSKIRLFKIFNYSGEDPKKSYNYYTVFNIFIFEQQNLINSLKRIIIKYPKLGLYKYRKVISPILLLNKTYSKVYDLKYALVKYSSDLFTVSSNIHNFDLFNSDGTFYYPDKLLLSMILSQDQTINLGLVFDNQFKNISITSDCYQDKSSKDEKCIGFYKLLEESGDQVKYCFLTKDIGKGLLELDTYYNKYVRETHSEMPLKLGYNDKFFYTYLNKGNNCLMHQFNE